MNTVHLIGADQVERAGFTIQHAAEQMQSAANSIDASLQQHQRFLDEWLRLLETVLTESKP